MEKLWLPLVVALFTLCVATLLAWFCTERWQKTRQRRELQFQELIKFSEKADRILGGLAAIYPAIRSGVEQEANLREKLLDPTFRRSRRSYRATA